MGAERLDVEVGRDARDDGATHEVGFGRPGGRSTGRWLAVGAVAAAVTLVAARLLSGAGDGVTAPTTGPPATIPSPSSTAVGRPLLAGPLDRGGAQAWTATTVAPARAPGPLLGAPAGIGLVVASDRQVVTLDLDTGAVHAVRLGQFGFGAQMTGLGLLYHAAVGATYVVRPGEQARLLSAFVLHPLGQGPPGRDWFESDAATPSGRRLWYSDGPGDLLHDVPVADGAGLVMADGARGLVAGGAGGGVYRLTPDGGAVRLNDGNLLDAAGGHLLIQSCDDRLRCRLEVHDGDGVLEWSLPPAVVSGASVSPAGAWVATTAGAVSTGGRRVLTVTGIDGTTIELGPVRGDCSEQGCLGARWSPDGSWLVGLGDEHALVTWRAAGRERRTVPVPDEVTDPLVPIRSFAVVPAERLPILSAAPG